MRCRIVLACADPSLSGRQIADKVGCSTVTVSKWRKRFAAHRLDGLSDEPRPGAVRTIGDDVVEQVVIDTLESAPKDATHWSTRSMADKHGISRQTVSKIWRAFGLKPWEIDEFKISPDPQLVEKIRDIVGLHTNPPVNAAVFAVDEKPQIQALNRTAPMLPMMPPTSQRRSHDYQRNGTIDLFADLDIATGTVISELRPNHTSAEFIKFLNKINREVPDDLDARRVGQPVDPQDPGGAQMAAASPLVHVPVHADLRVMDEPRGTLVLGAHHQETATLRPRLRARARRRHPRLGRHLERQPETVRLAQDRRRNPRTPRPLLRRRHPHRISQTEQRDSTLGAED